MTYGALLMLDMNDFKEINDNYGHAIGDKIITKTAKRLDVYKRQVSLIVIIN